MKTLNPLGETHLGDMGQTHLIAFFEKDTGLKHTHTQGSGNLDLISHNSQHTKAGNS